MDHTKVNWQKNAQPEELCMIGHIYPYGEPLEIKTVASQASLACYQDE